MKQYKHFISLGFFCSVSLEMERIGLRSTSSPFDWCISDFEGVIAAIENNFDDFLSYDYLLQNKKYREYYFNEKYKIWFYHDFNRHEPLQEQLPNARDKYLRRIERFYKNIKEPTLFIRYISPSQSNELGNPKELEWIENNEEYIMRVLKSFNEENDIIYISNELEGKTPKISNIYFVEKDKHNSVARKFLKKNKDLMDLFISFDYELRQDNIKVFKRKQRTKNNIILKYIKKIFTRITRKISPGYLHDKIYLEQM